MMKNKISFSVCGSQHDILIMCCCLKIVNILQVQCKEPQDVCSINAVKADTEVPVIFVYDYCYSTSVKCTYSQETNLVHQAIYPTQADTFTTSPERARIVKVLCFS